jgi:hypothetical protein
MSKKIKTLRDYIISLNDDFSERIRELWRRAEPIHNRQNRTGRKEDGRCHVEIVDSNIWALLNKSNKIDEFSRCELFLLSCCACCHDFDKGLFENHLGNEHGYNSGKYVEEKAINLALTKPEAYLIRKIISIHNELNDNFKNKLKKIENVYPLINEEIRLKKLTIILKTADILHTDNSRTLDIGLDKNNIDKLDKNKQLAREAITGWRIDGSRIIFNAISYGYDCDKALEGCFKYLEEHEWTSVQEKLMDYGFPYKLEFKVNSSELKRVNESYGARTKDYTKYIREIAITIIGCLNNFKTINSIKLYKFRDYLYSINKVDKKNISEFIYLIEEYNKLPRKPGGSEIIKIFLTQHDILSKIEKLLNIIGIIL